MRNITVHTGYSKRFPIAGNIRQHRFQASDMIGSYRWPVSIRDISGLTDDPENLVLNRSNGFDVLSFIIECAEKWNWDEDDRASCLKLERLILFNVPEEYMTRVQVRSWIEKYFSVKYRLS